MKKTLLAATLTAAVAVGPITAQDEATMNAEREGVVAAALDYMEGALLGDVDRMARGVHPQLNKVVVSTNRETGRQSRFTQPVRRHA